MKRNAHHTQFPETPLFLTISVTRLGVSVENVVATIEIPNNHQGIFLPDKKYSLELEEESEVDDCEVQHLNQDWDELIDIKPGTLTVSRGMRATRHESDLFGELKVNTFKSSSFRGFKMLAYRSTFQKIYFYSMLCLI